MLASFLADEDKIEVLSIQELYAAALNLFHAYMVFLSVGGDYGIARSCIAVHFILADYVKGQITGIDLFPDFIEIFNENAVKANCADRVKGITGSMDNLPFQNEELDLIWSEGAIYNIGFERGMNEWNKYLKKGGFIAVSEASWFTSERPAEIEDFWMDAYPEISVIPTCIDKMERAGYTPIAHFILPENCWTEHYFAPQDEVRETFMKEHAGNKTAMDFMKGQQYERSLYSKYKDYYGYVFYIGQKR